MEKKKRKGFFTFNKQSFVGRTDGNLTDHYRIKKEIGKGSYGRVYQVEHKISNEIRACKHLSKINLQNNDKLNTEIKKRLYYLRLFVVLVLKLGFQRIYPWHT